MSEYPIPGDLIRRYQAFCKCISRGQHTLATSAEFGKELIERIARLSSENTRLREALERLIKEHGMSYPIRRDAIKSARAALAEKGTK